jgi:hypothetical protein
MRSERKKEMTLMYGTIDHMREEMTPRWTEVPRDLNAVVIGTMLSDDGWVVILYEGRQFAVVHSKSGRA